MVAFAGKELFELERFLAVVGTVLGPKPLADFFPDPKALFAGLAWAGS
jgi:hypothetical protein